MPVRRCRASRRRPAQGRDCGRGCRPGRGTTVFLIYPPRAVAVRQHREVRHDDGAEPAATGAGHLGKLAVVADACRHRVAVLTVYVGTGRYARLDVPARTDRLGRPVFPCRAAFFVGHGSIPFVGASRCVDNANAVKCCLVGQSLAFRSRRPQWSCRNTTRPGRRTGVMGPSVRPQSQQARPSSCASDLPPVTRVPGSHRRTARRSRRARRLRGT